MTMPDVVPWREALPRPATHNYNTPLRPVHVGILMRCAERYSLNNYRDHA
jgi:hypothetical protein